MVERKSFEERSKIILDSVKKNPNSSIHRICMMTGLDYTTTYRDMHELERLGKVKFQRIAGAKIVELVEDDDR